MTQNIASANLLERRMFRNWEDMNCLDSWINIRFTMTLELLWQKQEYYFENIKIKMSNLNCTSCRRTRLWIDIHSSVLQWSPTYRACVDSNQEIDCEKVFQEYYTRRCSYLIRGWVREFTMWRRKWCNCCHYRPFRSINFAIFIGNWKGRGSCRSYRNFWWRNWTGI